MSQQDQPTPQQFCLDVAYGSNAATRDTAISAMAFGFAKWITDSQQRSYYTEQGQRPEAIPIGSLFTFNVLDTDSEAWGSPEIIEIHFNGETCPFDNTIWINGMFTVPGDGDSIKQSNATSAGCNLIGTMWQIGPFTAVNPGKFDCTVTVTVLSNDGKGTRKRFQIDPEMDVEAGG